MRWRVAAGVGLLVLAATDAPASAEGLFDMLMGGSAPAPTGAPADGGTLTVHRRHQRRPMPRRVAQTPPKTLQTKTESSEGRHKAEVAIDPAKVADWYLHDRTLRRGDIVVLKNGVLVYKGRQAGEARRPADFARLREARFLPARTRDFVAKATAVNPYAAAVVAPPKPKVRPSAT